jgi:hypothetical protein
MQSCVAGDKTPNLQGLNSLAIAIKSHEARIQANTVTPAVTQPWSPPQFYNKSEISAPCKIAGRKRGSLRATLPSLEHLSSVKKNCEKYARAVKEINSPLDHAPWDITAS